MSHAPTHTINNQRSGTTLYRPLQHRAPKVLSRAPYSKIAHGLSPLSSYQIMCLHNSSNSKPRPRTWQARATPPRRLILIRRQLQRTPHPQSPSEDLECRYADPGETSVINPLLRKASMSFLQKSNALEVDGEGLLEHEKQARRTDRIGRSESA